jgi:hypothetical protein
MALLQNYKIVIELRNISKRTLVIHFVGSVKGQHSQTLEMIMIIITNSHKTESIYGMSVELG